MNTTDERYEITTHAEARAALDEVRERALRLPTYHKLRVRYRDLRRALVNISEDVAYTGGTSADVDGIYSTIERFIAQFERAWAQGYYIDRNGKKHPTQETHDHDQRHDEPTTQAGSPTAAA